MQLFLIKHWSLHSALSEQHITSSAGACEVTWLKDVFIIKVAEVNKSLMISQISINWIAVIADPERLSYLSFTATNSRFPQQNVSYNASRDAELNVKWNVRTDRLLSWVTCETLIENGPGSMSVSLFTAFPRDASICLNLPFFPFLYAQNLCHSNGLMTTLTIPDINHQWIEVVKPPLPFSIRPLIVWGLKPFFFCSTQLWLANQTMMV